MDKERQELLRQHPFKPCDRCFDGWLYLRSEDGKKSVAVECACRVAWLAEINGTPDEELVGKEAATGERQ